MTFDLTESLYALADALDCVEHDLVGVTTYHSKRVVYICALMGRRHGLTQEQLVDLAGCAMLHDNALTEYVQAEYTNKGTKQNIKDLGIHCQLGEINLKKIKFFGDITNAVMYHHENADGTGPFCKTAKEVPLYARWIHLADMLDSKTDMSFIDKAKYERIQQYLMSHRDQMFDSETIDCFLEAFSFDTLQNMRNEKLDRAVREVIPALDCNYSNEEMLKFASVFAKIVDYKSEFTRKHSLGIAEKAMKMGAYYGENENVQTQLYLAGALHDIGKLIIDKDVLEKPAKLTEQEFQHIQTHAYATYDVLRKIKGFEEITNWASLHHEKLDGTGYPFGKTAEELSQKERLLGCLDIYQALTEERPYKNRLPHKQAIEIMRNMVSMGKIDGKIVEDLQAVFG